MPRIWDDIKKTWKNVDDSTSGVASAIGTSGVGWAEEGFKYAGKAASKFGAAISKAGKAIKAASTVSKVASVAGAIGKALGPIGGILSFWADRKKDAMIEAQLSGLADQVGDLRDGLNNVNNKLEAQGKALQGQIEGVKYELEDALKQQGEHFDREIKNLDAKIDQVSGQMKKELEREREVRKREMQQQKEELSHAINDVKRELIRANELLKKELDDFKNEVNERFEQQERKILENKRRVEEERIKREEEIREVKDKIKFTNTNLENLRKEKDELVDEQLRFKNQIDQKTAQTQQAFEDLEAEYQRKTKILEAQIEDNQETIEEFNEQLNNFQREQAFQREQQEEIWENLQEQSDILHFQKHQLNLVSERMEEIHEEVHDRMNKIQTQQDKLAKKTEETYNLAQETVKKVDKLTEEVSNISQKTFELEQQIEKNKQDIQQVKEDAKLTNERLDNLIKSQQLLDFSAEQSAIRKIEKSLELKAEEAKLLATLNLLKETKQLLPLEFSEREWKVGIKEGTEKEMPRSEGYLLSPNSRWAKMYTPEQLQEWGWDTRLLGDNETAPLMDEDKRKPEQVDPSSNKKSEEQEEQKETNSSLLEKFTELEKETIARLQTIQQEVNQELEEAEEQASATSPKPSNQYNEKIKSVQQKINQLNAEVFQKEKETKKATQKALNTPNIENKRELQQAKEEEKKVQKQLDQAQTELETLARQQEFEKELEEKEAKMAQMEKQELEKKWEEVQALSKQALEKQEEEEPEELLPEEKELEEKLEELAQQLNQQEQAQVASQKTMSYFMLYLIIFLLEYIVYKRNGLPGLVILNVLLAIAYYHRDTLKEHAELWGKYLLIIGYVMGNVLAYSAPEQEKYKWPCVIGFNLIILGIYAYNYYQQHSISLKITQTQQAIKKAETKLVEKKLQIKEQEIKQQTETLQKATEIEEKLKKAQDSLGDSPMTWEKIKTNYPEFANKSILLKEFEKVDRILTQEEKQISHDLDSKLSRLSILSAEELNLLRQLSLTREQFVALATQANQYLSLEEKEEIQENFFSFPSDLKLRLINSGLNNLKINTLEKKKKFVELNHLIHQEKNNFGLTVKEKESILRLLITSLDLSPEQRQSLENMGVSFFDATNWQVSEEQRNNLLDFGLSKLELTKEQQESLLNTDQFKTFSLTEPQKNILQKLAPLIKEDKHSEKSLKVLCALQLKSSALSFLINEEIVPNPNLDFCETKSPYLPLKIKFLEGEQKILREQAKVKEKKLREEEIQEQKFSIIRSLLNLAQKRQEGQSLNISLPLDSWVKIGALQPYQKNILLTLGFKTVPKYNYWQLLIFSVENFTDYSWDDFLSENMSLNEDYQEYLNSLNNQEITINETIWERFVATRNKKEKQILQELNLEELINEKINQALTGYQPKEVFYDSQEELSETEEATDPKPTPSTSRYDNLFANLSKEDAEWQRKKQEYEASKKKFQEQEKLRREEKLAEKDKKLKEDEERRKQERELAEQEEKKRKEAEEARAKAAQEEQESYLKRKLANAEEAKKRAEQALENQKRENEIQEKKKRDEIEKLEKENQEEQKRLAKQDELIEEEKQKKLAAIALEDEEQRQLIEKRANEEKARIQEEMNEKKRRNEEKLKKKENALLKEKQEKQLELEKLQKEVDLQNRIAEETKRIANRQVQILKNNRDRESRLRTYRESLWNEVKDYYWANNEAKDGTRNPNLTSGGHLRDWLNSYPNMKFNLVFGDQYSVNWTNNKWRIAMKAFYGCAGNSFVDQYEFKRLLDQKVQSLDFTDSINV